MYHVFICFIWIFTVHVFLVCSVQLSHVQWVGLGPGSIDLDDSWCCDFGARTIYFLNPCHLCPPHKKTGPDKGSLAWWWNHLGWALVEIPQVSTKPKLSSYNDAVGNGGKGENPGCRPIFFVARCFCLLWDGVAFTFFLQKLLVGKKVRFFCCKKKTWSKLWWKSSAKLRCRWRQAVVGFTSASMALESRGRKGCRWFMELVPNGIWRWMKCGTQE